MVKKGIAIMGYIVLWLSLFFSSSWGDTVKDIEGHLMCMCRDKCGKVLQSCICKYSDQYRMDIALKLKEGLTRDQVIKTYVDRYGEKVLSAPTKKGFNLAAWITPFFVIMIGGIGIRKVVSKWVSQRENQKKSKVIEQIDVQKDNKYSRLLEKELKEFD